MNIKGQKIKKRYIALGLIALEVISFPVSAHIIHKTSFAEPEKVAAAPFPEEAGITKFLMSSNTPFTIVSEGASGEFDIQIKRAGRLNGLQYGAHAQMPGPAKACAASTTITASKIYEADRKTETGEGDVLTHAVIVEIRYTKDIQPDFKIIAKSKAKRIPAAAACKTKIS